MNLQDMRSYMRRQLDVDDEELPNEMANDFLREAFARTFALETEWPTHQKTWTITKAEDAYSETLPTDLSPGGLRYIRNADTGKLLLLDHQEARERSWGTSGTPAFYSVWAGSIFFWPEASAEIEYELQGYRDATDWVSGGAAAEPDIHEDLHRPLLHYAIALAYLQQEDDFMEATYMARWARDVMPIRKRVMQTSQNTPVIMNRGTRPLGRRGWSLVL